MEDVDITCINGGEMRGCAVSGAIQLYCRKHSSHLSNPPHAHAICLYSWGDWARQAG
jgi:hypothetical protein